MFWTKKLLVTLGMLLMAGPASAQDGRQSPQQNDNRPATQGSFGRDEGRSRGRGGSDRGENRSRKAGGFGRDDNRPLSADEIAQRVSRAEGFLKRLDANGDGKIDADEVAEGPGKFLIERMFSRSGKQLQYPITLSDLKQAMENDLRTRGSGPPPGGNGPPSPGMGGPPPGFPNGPGQGPPGMGPSGSDAFSFGRRDRSGVGGHGPATRPSTMNPMAGPSTTVPASATPGISPPGAAPGPAKPSAPPAPAGTTPSAPGTSATGTASAPRKPARFLTAWERLPKDLPDWFYDRDADADGQVTMAEFSSHWTPETAAEFNGYDLNRDGIVTAAEYLRLLTEREKQEKQGRQQGFPRESSRRRGG